MMELTKKPAAAIYLAKISDFVVDELVCFLSDEEKLRLDKFRQAGDKLRHILAHSLKRVVLSQYLHGSTPRGLRFSRSSSGKPFCLCSDSPYFNLSHSGEWVALAVSVQDEVGVDIEFERELDSDALIRRIGSDKEVSIYQLSASPKKSFLCFWTQKEAVSKACGQGISVGLSSIPASGKVGEYAQPFLGVNYTSYTYEFFDSGILSYSSASPLVPEIVRVTSVLDYPDGVVTESGVFTL